MSEEQQLIYGFSQTELEALRIPNKARNHCLPVYVPYVKCFYKSSAWDDIMKRSCLDERRNYNKCRMEDVNRMSYHHLKMMKKKNAALFDELKVAPTVEQEYNPSFLDYTRGH